MVTYAPFFTPLRIAEGTAAGRRGALTMSQQSLQKSKIKFLLLEGVHPSAVEALRSAGYNNIDQHPKALPVEELKSAIMHSTFL